MPKYRMIIAVSSAFSAAAGALWALAADLTAGGGNPGATELACSAAAALTTVAALCWIAFWRAKRDHDKTILIKAIAVAATARRGDKTMPFPRVF